MNNVEAKFILQGYRPNGADAGDVTFGAALEQTTRDPALRDWFAREQLLDAAMAEKFSQVQPPAGLREAILAGGRVTAASDTTQRSWWLNPVWMAAAASLALLGAVGVAVWPKSAIAAPRFIDFAAADASRESEHGGHGKDVSSLQAELSGPTMRLGEKLPVDFASLQKSGCRTISFEGREVLEVCFTRNGAWFHCYIAKRADFSSMLAEDALRLVDKDSAGLAIWSDASYLYVVVSKSGRAALQALL